METSKKRRLDVKKRNNDDVSNRPNNISIDKIGKHFLIQDTKIA